MQKKYPENITGIENFYQNSLEGIKIEPPAELWDRIDSAMNKRRKPRGFWYTSNAKKFISVSGAILVTAVLLSYFVLTNRPETIQQEVTPSFQTDSSSSESKVTNPGGTELTDTSKEKTGTEKAEQKKGERKEAKNKELQPVPQNLSTQHITPVEKDSTDILLNKKEETQVLENEKKEEKPKEKVSFKEKYRKKYQDSTRPLFVPTK